MSDARGLKASTNPVDAHRSNRKPTPLFDLPAVGNLERPGVAAAVANVHSLVPVSSMAVVSHARLIVVDTDTKLVEAAALMSSEQGSLAVVCDWAGAVQGVITDTMLIHQLGLANPQIFSERACEVMPRDFASCAPTDSLAQVLTTMHRRGLVHMAVVGINHKPVGVVCARDGLRALAAAGNFEESQLRDCVMGVGCC